ncbi:hypothetical protein LCGC14_0861470 [marine sediment metagenome]|uniref:Uncharacterized protein n=1 Tax=marine sediment metagenome TaxID=412755 RepID=A0A0F9SE94_9ZZZZ
MTKEELVQAHWDNVIELLDIFIEKLEKVSDSVEELRQYYGQDVGKWQ